MGDNWEEDSHLRRVLPLGGRLPVAMVAACPFPANRGTPIRIQQMSEALAALEYDVHIVTYHLGTERPLPGVTVHRTPPVRFYRNFGAGPSYTKLFMLDPLLVCKLLSVVRRHRIRVIHAHHFEGALCALVVKKILGGVQVIYDAHTSLQDELLAYDFPMPAFVKKAACGLLDPGVPRWCDHVISVSERLAAFVVSTGVPRSKVTVIPMSVNRRDFTPQPAAEAREALGLGQEPLVLYTGNLAEFQGVGALLRAFASVCAKDPDVRLVIVGAPTSTYEEMARGLQIDTRVTFAGERSFDEVRTFLSAADVVALPRDNCVGFPLKLLNYMASGKAIVAFEGGAPNVLEHGRNGYLVANGDEQGFGEGILTCLRDHGLRDAMGAGAQESASRFDVDAMAENIAALYDNLRLDGRPHHETGRA